MQMFVLKTENWNKNESISSFAVGGDLKTLLEIIKCNILVCLIRQCRTSVYIEYRVTSGFSSNLVR